jgi:sulfur carrier protein ThiS
MQPTLEPTTSPFLFNATVDQVKTVRMLLQDLHLTNKCIAVLIDGRKAELDQEIQKGQKVIILPVIAGGM